MDVNIVARFVVFVALLPSTALAQVRPGAEAEAAYRDLVELGPTDPEAYLNGFASTLECLYGEVNAPRARLRMRMQLLGAYLEIGELHIVDATPERVTLVDRGWYGGDGQLAFHEKVVELRRVEGRWIVTGETGARSRGCLRDVLERAPPASARFVACQRAVRPVVRAMERRCDEPENVHGCAASTEQVLDTINACVFGRTVDFARVPRVSTVREVSWPTLAYRDGHFESVVFGDVDGDRREDAVVALRFPGRRSLEAYAVRNHRLVELGTVWEHGEPAVLLEVRVERRDVLVVARQCVHYGCVEPSVQMLRRRLRRGTFVEP